MVTKELDELAWEESTSSHWKSVTTQDGEWREVFLDDALVVGQAIKKEAFIGSSPWTVSNQAEPKHKLIGVDEQSGMMKTQTVSRLATPKRRCLEVQSRSMKTGLD